MTALSLETGQRLKREGQETVAATNVELATKLRAYARLYAHAHGQVTTDDLRLYAASKGWAPTHHNFWGVVFRGRGWVCIGRKPSELATNHYREIRVWQWGVIDRPAQAV